jgi:hypothetical protein
MASGPVVLFSIPNRSVPPSELAKATVYSRMVLAGGSSREALEVELLGFEGVGWGGGFDFGDEVGDFTFVHASPSTTRTHGCACICRMRP